MINNIILLNIYHQLNKNKNKYYLDKSKLLTFKYENYENNIITEYMKRYSGWLMTQQERNFINGIIRKNKLKNCLEIGVGEGGSSIFILNAIKDFENSVLVSLDLFSKMKGYRVNKFFPELTKKWKLYTGDQPHKFLIKLNMKFDFLLLDSAHVSPGEILNFIEALPFLKENAIVIVHDLLWHFYKRKKIKYFFYPSCVNLIPAIFGEKIILGYNNSTVNNIVAISLYSNQQEHYLDYFLLLLNFWEYMPNDHQINDLRIFIKKYYKKEIYLNIFNLAVSFNKQFTNKTKINLSSTTQIN